ncbi:uncharacterized protein A4U43_C08F13380 [Asparagus officinalis]|nr:uncharacterized protein A4U43_C08F13380 [Asparagus officinalis]
MIGRKLLRGRKMGVDGKVNMEMNTSTNGHSIKIRKSKFFLLDVYYVDTRSYLKLMYLYEMPFDYLRNFLKYRYQLHNYKFVIVMPSLCKKERMWILQANLHRQAKMTRLAIFLTIVYAIL